LPRDDKYSETAVCLPVCVRSEAYKSTVSSKVKYGGKCFMMCQNPAGCSNQEKVQYLVPIKQEILGTKGTLLWNKDASFKSL